MTAVVVFTVLAALELVADELPSTTPSRTAPPGLIARIAMGETLRRLSRRRRRGQHGARRAARHRRRARRLLRRLSGSNQSRTDARHARRRRRRPGKRDRDRRLALGRVAILITRRRKNSGFTEGTRAGRSPGQWHPRRPDQARGRSFRIPARCTPRASSAPVDSLLHPARTTLTRAPHVTASRRRRSSSRFSELRRRSDGSPTTTRTARPARHGRSASQLAEHVHTDIVAHSENGFPTRTGEEFLRVRARPRRQRAERREADADRDVSAPQSASAKHFVEAPKPIPTSFARESYFGVSALRFTNRAGVSRYGRFRIHPPKTGTSICSAAEAAKKSATFLADELPQRLARGAGDDAASLVQMAEAGDELADSTVSVAGRSPADRVRNDRVDRSE